MEEYTLIHVAAAAGLKPRTVQVWTDAGVLQPLHGTDRQGRGVHRRYDRDELLIACILAGHDRMHTPLGALLDMARRIRASMEILRPKFLETMNSDISHVLVFRFWDFEEDSFGSDVEIMGPKTKPAGAGEIVHHVQLKGVFSGLKHLH